MDSGKIDDPRRTFRSERRRNRLADIDYRGIRVLDRASWRVNISQVHSIELRRRQQVSSEMRPDVASATENHASIHPTPPLSEASEIA
jgi:hypothetical protein